MAKVTKKKAAPARKTLPIRAEIHAVAKAAAAHEGTTIAAFVERAIEREGWRLLNAKRKGGSERELRGLLGAKK